MSINTFIITDVLGKVQHIRRFYRHKYLNSLPRKRSFGSSRNPREGKRDEVLRTWVFKQYICSSKNPKIPEITSCYLLKIYIHKQETRFFFPDQKQANMKNNVENPWQMSRGAENQNYWRKHQRADLWRNLTFLIYLTRVIFWPPPG